MTEKRRSGLKENRLELTELRGVLSDVTSFAKDMIIYVYPTRAKGDVLLIFDLVSKAGLEITFRVIATKLKDLDLAEELTKSIEAEYWVLQEMRNFSPIQARTSSSGLVMKWTLPVINRSVR